MLRWQVLSVVTPAKAGVQVFCVILLPGVIELSSYLPGWKIRVYARVQPNRFTFP